jgi:hypothetical protein
MTVTKNIEIFVSLPVSATAMWNPANKIADSVERRSILSFLICCKTLF